MQSISRHMSPSSHGVGQSEEVYRINVGTQAMTSMDQATAIPAPDTRSCTSTSASTAAASRSEQALSASSMRAIVPIPHAGGTGPRRGPDVNAHANCVRIHAWARGSRRRRRTSRRYRLLTARCMRSPTHHVPAPPCPASLARSHIEASMQLQDGVLNSRASWPLTASRRC